MMFAILMVLVLVCPQDTAAADLAAARELFERNIEAIQQRDREAYLACYLADEGLIRSGPGGPDLGFAELAEGTPDTDSDEWPVSLVARDLQLHWLEAGWVFGTYRYRVDFGGSVAEGLSERLFRKTPEGWRIVMTSAFAAEKGTPPPPLALVGATLHDGNGDEAIEDAVIIVRDGRIEAVGPRDTTPVPDGIEVFDITGTWVVPGLVDTHVHYSQTGWADGRPDAHDARAEFPLAQVAAELEAAPERLHRAFLANGVTAVFDVGGYPWTRGVADQAELDTSAPHMAATGPLLSTFVPPELMLADRSQFVLMEDEEGVRSAVRSHAASGSDAIKVWFVVREPGDIERFEPLVLAAGDEADRVGLPLVVHATEQEAARVALEAGAELLVHSVNDETIDLGFVTAAVDAGVFYCPTLIVSEGYLHLYRREIPGAVGVGLDWVDPSIRERVALTKELPPDPDLPPERVDQIEARQQARAEVMAANLMRLHEAGVSIVLGTDAGNPLTLHGPSVFREAEAMAAAGLTPLEVLTAATRDAAAAMGRGDDLGLIAPGRIADLLILEKDPATNVTHLRSLTHVMRGGELRTREFLRPR